MFCYCFFRGFSIYRQIYLRGGDPTYYSYTKLFPVNAYLSWLRRSTSNLLRSYHGKLSPSKLYHHRHHLLLLLLLSPSPPPTPPRSSSSSVISSFLTWLSSHPSSWPFLQPVDPVALNIPTYFSEIKRPMDISTMAGKSYGGVEEMREDLVLMFENAVLFNGPDSEVGECYVHVLCTSAPPCAHFRSSF